MSSAHSTRHARTTLPPPLSVSHIRESMVKIMLTPGPGPPANPWNDRDDGWQPDGIGGGEEAPKASDGADVVIDPPTCIFWCAVALGALVRGSPLETVRRVCR